jgi:predicted small secreted protein
MKSKIALSLVAVAALALTACTNGYYGGDVGRHRILYDPASRHIDPACGWYDVCAHRR